MTKAKSCKTSGDYLLVVETSNKRILSHKYCLDENYIFIEMKFQLMKVEKNDFLKITVKFQNYFLIVYTRFIYHSKETAKQIKSSHSYNS